MINAIIVGDFNEGYVNHINTNRALLHAANALKVAVSIHWLSTERVNVPDLLQADMIWCAPGSPYKSMEGALTAIRFAREHNVPFIGTCGGFQHAVVEYARSVAGIADATHAEYDPAAQTLVITPLTCSVAGQLREVALTEGTLAYNCYGGQKTITEQFHCNYGINPAHLSAIADKHMIIAGADSGGEVRILELRDNDFFVATLFLPQSISTEAAPHPLITHLLKAAISYSKTSKAISI